MKKFIVIIFACLMTLVVNSQSLKIFKFTNVQDIELAPDGSIFLINSDSLWHVVGNSYTNITIPKELVYDISISKSYIYMACFYNLYRIPLTNLSIVESIDNWQWDPFTKVNVKPGTDSLLFYITSWGITRSGWTFRTPSGQLTRLTSGGAGYGVWDKVSDSTCYIYVYNSRRYNLNNFTYLTISATDNFVDIKDSFSLNGKSTLVNSSAFSIDYGNTWTTFTKPSNLPPVYNLGFVKIDENTLALSDDNLNRIILVKDGTLYPTTLETPDIFNLKVFDGKYLWGIGLGGNVIRLEYANFDIITGISSEYNDKILVYPNPVIDNLKIEYSGDFDIKFEISNSVGQTVSYGKMFKNISIPISSFQSGIYIIKFNIGNKIEFRKFIKN